MEFVLSCTDNRKSQAQRNFTHTQKDPNNSWFCTPAFAPICAYPFPNSGQGAQVGDTVFPNNCRVQINNQLTPLSCQALVDWKLNEAYDPTFVTNSLYNNGCGVTTNTTTGRRVTGCSFSDQVLPKFLDSCQVRTAGSVVDDCTFQWICTVAGYDQRYKPVCCNAPNIEYMGDQIDPYTGLPFNGRNMCAPNWCLQDPKGECLDMFMASCSTTSSCYRHAFLSSNFPVSTTDLLINTIKINGTSGQGFQCFNWYGETKEQAVRRSILSNTTFSTTVNDRLTDTINIVKAFCANPETKGNGECACINAYTEIGAEFATSLQPDALTFQFDNANIPIMLEQTDAGNYRRIDAFCAPTNRSKYTQQWLDQLTYTLGTQTLSLSNVCSQSGSFWFNSPLEYTLPSMNPNRNLNSLSNFGDVVNDANVLNSFRNLGQNLNFAMPLHCWHPACVGRSQMALDNPSVFLDLYAFTQTCPDVCYMYSGADNISIGGNIGTQTFININNDYQTCDFAGQNQQHVYEPFPFALPSGCQQLIIQAPVNFSDTIHITITNPDVDISSVVASKTVAAFSNMVPLVSFASNTSKSAAFGPEVLWKYSFTQYSGSTVTIDTIVLSVTVDTTNMSPFTSFQSEINIQDNYRNLQQLQVQVYVYPDAVGAGGSTTTVLPYACGEVEFNASTGLLNCVVPCDCTFGSNSTAGACASSFSLVDPNLAHTTGFSSDGDPIIRPLRQLLAPLFPANPVSKVEPNLIRLAQALRFG